MPGTPASGSRVGLIAEFSGIVEITTTLPNHSAALDMANGLLESRLCACVHIAGPILSVYRWQGAVQREEEYSLQCKTTELGQTAVVDRIRDHHPYALPQIVVMPIQATHAYATWVREQVESHE